MRFLGPGLLLILVFAGSASALPPPDPSGLPDAGVTFYCGQVGERTVHYEPGPPPQGEPPPPPPPPPYEWKRVDASIDWNACVKPIVDACSALGQPCCGLPANPCAPNTVLSSATGRHEVGVPFPIVGGGVCLSWKSDGPNGPSEPSVDTRYCLDEQQQPPK
jgi:hypothetical protein